MRSVFIHIKNTNIEEISKFLQKHYPSQEGPPWILKVNDDPCLHIDFYRDSQIEFSQEELEALKQKLGDTPSLSLMADVSGRHAGDQQVKDFISLVLENFEGLAQDDYSEHFWTLNEIVSGKAINESGKEIKFFDYKSV